MIADYHAQLAAAAEEAKATILEFVIDQCEKRRQLYAAMTRYLMGLGRIDEAVASVSNALNLAPEDREIRARERRIKAAKLLALPKVSMLYRSHTLFQFVITMNDLKSFILEGAT